MEKITKSQILMVSEKIKICGYAISHEYDAVYM